MAGRRRIATYLPSLNDRGRLGGRVGSGFAFLDCFGDAVAGGLILTTGGVLAVLGL